MVNAYSFKVPFPPGGPEIEFRVEPKRWDRLKDHNTTDFMNLETCYHVIKNPERIFVDLKRPHNGTSDFLCVCGKPQHWYIREKKKIDFPDDLIWVVFLNSRYAIYEFGAENVDPGDKFSPENYGWRFGEEIKWKNS